MTVSSVPLYPLPIVPLPSKLRPRRPSPTEHPPAIMQPIRTHADCSPAFSSPPPLHQRPQHPPSRPSCWSVHSLHRQLRTGLTTPTIHLSVFFYPLSFITRRCTDQPIISRSPSKMPSTTSFQSQQQAVDSQRHRSPPPPAQSSSADQIPHPHHHQQHHHQQSYATTSTPQQYAAYYAHHHQHPALVDHPTDGTPLHDPQAQQQSLQQEQHPLVDSEGLAAAELLAAFPQSPATPSSPDVSSLPQQAAAALTAQEAASADASHSLHHQSTAQAIALPFPPPGSVPIAYFAGPNGSIIAIPQLKAKRRQVKNACTNCQKACKKCDEVRPCTRCVKYGIDKDCVDSQRKERKKGIKRGPYKKREPKGEYSTTPRSFFKLKLIS